jgi:hypothetical protein
MCGAAGKWHATLHMSHKTQLVCLKSAATWAADQCLELHVAAVHSSLRDGSQKARMCQLQCNRVTHALIS